MSEGNQLVQSVSGWIFPLRVRNFISRQTRLGIVYNIHLALNLFTVCWQQSLVTHTHTKTLTLSGLISSNMVKYAERLPSSLSGLCECIISYVTSSRVPPQCLSPSNGACEMVLHHAASLNELSLVIMQQLIDKVCEKYRTISDTL